MDMVFGNFGDDDCGLGNPLDNLPQSRANECLDKGDLEGFCDIFESLPRPLDESTTYGFLHRCMDASVAVLQEIWASGTPLAKREWGMYVRYLEEAVEKDRADVLEWLRQTFFPSEDALQGILEMALLGGALSCVESLLPKKERWEASKPILMGWASQYTGNPTFDACVAAMAPYFLCDPQCKEDKTPYHPMITMNLAVQYPKCVSACSPCVNYLIARGDLSPKELDREIDCLSMITTALMDVSPVTPMPNATVQVGRHSTHMRLDLPEPTYAQVATTLDALLTHYPQVLKKWKARSLVAALALVERPQPLMLAWAQRLTGKNLVIMDYGMPWIDRERWLPSFEEGKVYENNLLSRWEERMPKGLSPVISVSNFPRHADCKDFLAVCKVVGQPPADELSCLARAILDLESDDPCFLQAIAPGGVLHRERTNYLNWLAEEGTDHRAHYLTTLTQFKEGKSYDL